MLVLLIALLAAASCFAIVAKIFSLVGAILPALAVFGLTYWFLARRIGRQFEAAMQQAQTELQRGRIDRSIAVMEDIKRKFGNWQLFTKSAMDGQIGTIYYVRQEFDKAKPYLERAFVRHWAAKGMLAVLCFRKKDYAKMDKVFESAVKYSSKQGLLWSLWAYCHWKAGHTDKAIAILSRGQAKLKDADPRLSANLMSLQNDKKLKMRVYGEQWYQFHLEVSPQMKQARAGNVRYMQR